ncbi:MAG: Hsp20/alpha crystallin family protein [Lachnospiraceae bacterium]|nr:Hsp20/alpha crystallin family protein [Lachnospiraceae bacterium]
MLLPSVFGEDLFDDLFDGFARPVKKTNYMSFPASTVMKTDVKEHENGFELTIDVPGYKKDELKAELSDGYLTISAHKEDKKDDKKDGEYIRRERYVGTMSRSFYVGEALKKEDIHAHFEDGVLTLVIPKKELEEEKPKEEYIAIE